MSMGIFVALVVIGGVGGMIKVIFFDDDDRPSDRDY